jgi:ABC-type Fe3+ transport system permease subunit
MLSAAILMWATSISELSASIVVYSAGLETMPIAIFRQVDTGRLGLASAYGATAGHADPGAGAVLAAKFLQSEFVLS